MIESLKGIILLMLVIGAPAGCVYLTWPDGKPVLPTEKYCDAVFAYEREIIDQIVRIDEKLTSSTPEVAVGLTWLGDQMSGLLIQSIDENVEECDDDARDAAAYKSALKKQFDKKELEYVSRAREASGLKK